MPLPLRVLLLTLMAVLAGCSPAHDWREVRPEGSGLVLLLPCRPDAHARDVALAGRTLKLALVACSAGGQTWAVAYGDVADPAAVGPALDELRTAAARNLGAGAAPAPAALAVPGATPNAGSGRFAVAGKLPDGTAVQEQAAVFARGTLVFQATAVGAQLPAEAAETFFASLRFPS
jgi:hypothetical protein